MQKRRDCASPNMHGVVLVELGKVKVVVISDSFRGLVPLHGDWLVANADSFANSTLRCKAISKPHI